MTTPGSAQSFSLLGILFMAVGALILILALLNYFQDGRISLTMAFGLLGISAGAIVYSHAKKSKAQNK